MRNQNIFTDSVDFMIANGNVDTAINELLVKSKTIKEINSEFYQDTLLLSAKFNSFSKDYQKGVLNRGDYELNFSKLTVSALMLNQALNAILNTKKENNITNNKDKELNSELSWERINNNHFSPILLKNIRKFNVEIEKLKQSQLNIINILRYIKKAKIQGGAGSGKTLVAAEKAIQLSQEHKKVLFLCHNPLLANKIYHLIDNSNITVYDFSKWVSIICKGYSDIKLGATKWTHYIEPDADSLIIALEKLNTLCDEKYDAIIIDEGQDFREDWWVLIQAAFKNYEEGILYIFYDNNQSLLDRESSFPIKDAYFELSENCRNAGKIHKLMKYYDNSIIENSAMLKGEIEYYEFEKGKEFELLEDIVNKLHQKRVIDNSVLLLNSFEDLTESNLNHFNIKIRNNTWRDEVIFLFHKVIENKLYVSLPNNFKNIVLNGFPKKLSNNIFPTDEDIQYVCDLANSVKIEKWAIAKYKAKLKDGSYMYWSKVDENVCLRITDYPTAAKILMFFQSKEWALDIPAPTYVPLVPYYDYKEQAGLQLKYYNISDYKGLEADVAILLIRGYIHNQMQNIYVGISRAKFKLIILVDKSNKGLLPEKKVWST